MLVRSIDLAACIVRRPDGRVLLAERPAGRLAPGYWELPGGKIEPGETPVAAAMRELREEVGLTALALRQGPVHEYLFPTCRVRISFFQASAWQGDARGHEGQRIAWLQPAEPFDRPILPSNRRILGVLGLPPLAIHAELARGIGERAFLAAVDDVLRRRGRVLLRLHLPGLAPGQRVGLARRIANLARAWRAPVVIAGSPLEACQAGLDGIHSDCAGRHGERPPVGLWSVACGDAASLRRAAALGADLATLDVDAGDLARLAGEIPVALYGQGPGDAAAALRAGAAGVAVDLGDLCEPPRAGDRRPAFDGARVS